MSLLFSHYDIDRASKYSATSKEIFQVLIRGELYLVTRAAITAISLRVENGFRY